MGLKRLHLYLFDDDSKYVDRAVSLLRNRVNRGKKLLDLDVQKAHGADWWDFVESVAHPGHSVMSPKDRAAQPAAAAPDGIYWLVDLVLDEKLPGNTLTNLDSYFDARLAGDRRLAELWELSLRHSRGDNKKLGFALLAYASQHQIKARVFSRWSDLKQDERRLLAYLLEGVDRVPAREEFSFDKNAFSGTSAVTNSSEQGECDRILDWIRVTGSNPGDISTNKSDRARPRFLSQLATLVAWIAGVSLAIYGTVDHWDWIVRQWEAFRSLFGAH